MALYYNNQLFPPIISPSLPAYDGTKALKVYFQNSIANSRDQFQHVQVIIHRVDSNLNALNTATYPLGIIFIKNANILLDSELGLYYFTLPSNLLALDSLYKLQIRVGAQDLNSEGNTIQNHVWLNTPVVYNQFSEWSTVCVIKPITVPAFEMVGFTSKDINGNYIQPRYETDNIVNIANTPGFLFSGQYVVKDPLKEEKINSYQFILYEDNGTVVESSWTELSNSGVKYIGQYEATNIQHSFEYVLEKGQTYYVKLLVTSKNGYIGYKIYKVLVMYAEVNLYNTFEVTPNQDLAKISLHVEGKQLLFVANRGTIVEPTKDATVSPSILQTHMIINGTIKESNNLDFHAINGKWVVQLRALGIKPMETKAKALKNPFLTLTQNKASTTSIYNVIKLCAMKQLVSFASEATPRWRNCFILVKECWNKKGVLLLRQEKIVSFGVNKDGTILNSSLFINPLTEYYFYIREDSGYLQFEVTKLRTSTNSEIQTEVSKFTYNS